jgi:hypothetical protein
VVFGQSEAGQLTGKVTDERGAVVAGASVTVKAVDGGAVRQATTDGEGFYSVAGLQPGLYDVTVQATGFANRTQRVQVAIGSNSRLETKMSVTPVTEKQDVVVASGGVAANSQNYQLSDPVSQRQFTELPTITRDPYDLVSLSANLTPVPALVNNRRNDSYAINGQRPSGNSLQLDGGENMNTLTSELGQRIPLEAVQGMQVITSTYRPEYGRATGGIINVATRQGSNDFHGSLFEFHRNSEFASNSFENNALGIPRGHLVGNQFGYSAGGRLIRDRLFFFNSTEAIIQRGRENRLALVPTPQLLAASAVATRNFFNAFPLATPINGRVFTAGEIRNLTGFTATTGAFAALPATTPAFGLVQFPVATDTGVGAPQDTWMTVGRLDWNLTERSLMYARYAFEDRDLYGGTFSFSPFNGFNTGSRERNHSALWNWSNSLSPTWSYNTKVSFNRVNAIRNFGIAGPRLFFGNLPLTNIGGFALALPGDQPFDPAGVNAFTGPVNHFNAFQDFTTTWRNQHIRFGISYYYTQDNRTSLALQNSTAILGASLPQALNNLLLGQVSTFQTVINPQRLLPGQTITLPVSQPNFNRSISEHDFAAYFDHIWRAHPRVNVNWGLRYDFFGVPRSRNGQPFSNFVLGEGADVFTAIRNGSFQFVGSSSANRLYHRDWNNVAPRIGFAVDLTGSGRHSLRGGYGISYERTANNALFNVFRNTPNFAVVSVTGGVGTVSTLPLTVNNFGLLGGTTGTVTLPTFAVSAVERNLETPHVHFWNLVLESEFLPNTVASIQYAGSAGRDLFTLSNVNRPGSAAAFLNSTNATARLNPQFGPIWLLSSDGRSNYNALIVELNNSSWQRIGLNFTARYRFAKALDNVSTSLNNFNFFGAGMLDPFNPNLDYGRSDFDVRHRFVGSFNWEVPIDKIGDRFFGGGGTKAARLIFGGWSLSGIFDVHSGLPFTLFNCAGALTAEAPCPRLAASGLRSDFSFDSLVADVTIPNRFVLLNPTGLTALTPGAVFAPFPANMTTRNFFRGPRNWNLDAGLYKRFGLTESKSLQLRAELYNVFNHPQFFVPGSAIDIGSTSFVPAFMSGRRYLQLGAKITF